jgi:hypothetical protein
MASLYEAEAEGLKNVYRRTKPEPRVQKVAVVMQRGGDTVWMVFNGF